MTLDRRKFLKWSAALGAGALPVRLSRELETIPPAAPLFEISLAQWSLHRTLRARKLDNLDFAASARKDFGIEAVEYVNSFFKNKAEDKKYLGEMKKRAGDAGVKSLLIMVDGEGQIGHADEKTRAKSIDRHKKWVTAARFLGCHSIRVNAHSSGTREEQRDRVVNGLSSLASFAKDHQVSVIVENHGGLSSDGRWLAEVMKKVNLKNCGTLPDFGNFRLPGNRQYDRYKGVRELMPWAKAVSAKSYAFDKMGNDTLIDYRRMLKIVVDAGYTGWVGIEYEGKGLSEKKGILATKKLLETVRAELAKAR